MVPPPHVAPTPQRRRHYLCRRAVDPAEIDGRLDKPFWHAAPWTEDFVDIEGDPPSRLPPRHRTRAKMLWDDTYLYIGAEMEEPHVWGTLTERDSIVYHDNDIEVFLNPTGDSHNYYELEINALGTIFDLFLPKPYRDGGPADHAWDVRALRSAVHIDGTLNDPRDTDRAWSVELAFPWTAFDRHGGQADRPPRDGEQWRINFSRVQWDREVIGGTYRKVAGREEHNWVWSPQGVIDMHRPEQWGYVQFVGAGVEPSQERFRPDRSEAARDALHAVYYAQKAFRHAHGRWAADPRELRATEMRRPSLASGIEMHATPEGWEAALAFARDDGRPSTACIRHDSLVWMR